MAVAKQVANADWTGPENWAWMQIANGRVANFAPGHGDLDLRGPGKAEPARKLSAAFLRAILFERRWTEQVPVDGVRIAGARWEEPLLISHARLGWPLCLDACRFDGAVDMSGLGIDGRLSFAGSAFHGGGRATPGLCLDTASAQRADLSDGYFRHGASAVDATFAGALDLSRARLKSWLDLSRTKARCIRLREAATARILLSNCEVDQDLDFSGARVTGPIKMNDAHVGQDLWLGGSKKTAGRFAKEIDLSGARVDGILSMCGMTAFGVVNMHGIEVGKSVFLRAPATGDDERETGETVFVAGIDLSYAVIRGHLDGNWSRIGEDPGTANGKPVAPIAEQQLNLDMARIEGNVFLRQALLWLDASFMGTRITGNLNLSGGQFKAKLNLKDARLDGHLLLYVDGQLQTGCWGNMVLTNATVGGMVALGMVCEEVVSCSGLHAGSLFARSDPETSPATPVFRKAIELSHAIIDGFCDLDDARVEAEINLDGATVGRDLRLRCIFAAPSPKKDATGKVPPAPVVNLSTSTIEGQLILTLPLSSAGAGRDHRLDLRDTKVGSLQVSGPVKDSWPSPGSVQLDGFTFDRLGAFNVAKTEEMTRKPASWFRQWLALDSFSPQPYEQLAAVLRQAGHAEKANQILYEARERIRRESWSWGAPWRGFPRWLGLGLLKITIGYGIGLRFFYALLWVAGLTAVGVGVLLVHPPLAGSAVPLESWADRIAYSFDQLLPIVELSKSFGEVKLPHEAEQYFYLHRVLGFLLGGFITAGIAGLTQRSRG